MDRRTDILDKTLDLMAQEGAHGTSMRTVAAAAGINVATLYHYFPSKQELLYAAIAHRGAGGFEFGLPLGIEEEDGRFVPP